MHVQPSIQSVGYAAQAQYFDAPPLCLNLSGMGFDQAQSRIWSIAQCRQKICTWHGCNLGRRERYRVAVVGFSKQGRLG